MGRSIYVPKPPKKRSSSSSISKIFARVVLRHPHTRNELVSAASSQISSMGPRDSSERNGNAQSNGRGKPKAKITRSSSNTSLPDLTQEDVDIGMNAVRRISKILYFMQTYHEEVEDVERVYGLGIRQQDRIDELETMVTDLTVRKDQEMARLLDENYAYKADLHQLESDKEELDREKANMAATRTAMQADMQKQKEEEVGEAKKQISEKATARIKRVKEELEKKIKLQETENNGLRDIIQTLEKKNTDAQKNFDEQRECFEIEKRSSQSYIRSVETELRQIKALSTVSPQNPQFYINGFHELFERIQDVALNDFIFLPEDAKSLDSDAVRSHLCKASGIFEYPLLSSESAVATFLKQCAIQHYISLKMASIIQRQYLAESTPPVELQPGLKTMDFILDAISNVPLANPSQELSWRLSTIDKLDHLDSHTHARASNISTKPNEGGITQAILRELRYLQTPSEHRLSAKLTAIAKQAIQLWSALRRDSCRVSWDYDLSTDDRQKWDIAHYQEATNNPDGANPPSENIVAKLPSKPFVLFPRITGVFDDYDDVSPRVLHNGLALPHHSPAFLEGLQEIEHVTLAMKEFERGLRRRAGTQSSPVMENQQGERSALHGGV